MAKNKVDKILARAFVKFDQSVLLIRRSETDQARAGEWEIPGGLVEVGENLEEAVEREVYEETGIESLNTKYYSSSSYNFDGEHRMGVLFTVEAATNEVELSFEHDKFFWVNKNSYHDIELNRHYEKLLGGYFGTEKKQAQVEKTIVENTTQEVEHIKIYTDGGSRGNPGPSASGYVIMDLQDKILEEGGEYLGITTNNQAEYQAVKLALESAKKFSPNKIDMYVDSLLVVNQVKGTFKIKNRDLWPIYEAIKELAQEFDQVTFTHVKREYNSLADAQVNIVLDSQE